MLNIFISKMEFKSQRRVGKIMKAKYIISFWKHIIFWFITQFRRFWGYPCLSPRFLAPPQWLFSGFTMDIFHEQSGVHRVEVEGFPKMW